MSLILNSTGYGTISQINNYLFLSAARALTLDGLRARGISLIVNVTLELPNDFESEFEYLTIKIDDNPTVDISRYFDLTADKIQKVRKNGGKVLVHCIAGASRSASLCLAYLMKYENMKLKEAFTFLKSRRPIVHPNSGFFKQLIDYEKSIYGENTIKMVELSSAGSDVMIPDVYMQDYKGFVWLKSLPHVVKKGV